MPVRCLGSFVNCLLLLGVWAAEETLLVHPDSAGQVLVETKGAIPVPVLVAAHAPGTHFPDLANLAAQKGTESSW
jgi:hypothetical protein